MKVTGAFREIGMVVLFLSAITLVTALEVDPFLVEQKIQGLGFRDDTIDYGEQPFIWLEARGDKVYPQLLAALDNVNTSIATSALAILDRLPAKPELGQALLRIAGQSGHRIHSAAILSLCRFADLPEARPLLEQALDDVAGFPDPANRARFAEALGNKAKAIELLTLVFNQAPEYQRKEIVHRLTKLGGEAVPTLEKISQSELWRVAAQAFLNLAQLDPEKHFLTRSQKELLEAAPPVIKGGDSFSSIRQKKLAALPRGEIRPFVLRMLNTDAFQDALGILAVWKDKEALPQIRRMLDETKIYQQGFVGVAFLAIEEPDQAVKVLIDRIKKDPHCVFPQSVVNKISASEIPLERKLAFFRELRDQVGTDSPYLVPENLNLESTDKVDLLKTLLEEENDLRALGEYAHRTLRERNQAYVRGLTRALQRLREFDPVALQKQENLRAAVAILNACVGMGLPMGETTGNPFLTSSSPGLRVAAARGAVRQEQTRKEGLALLARELSGEARNQAARSLLGLPCLNEGERLGREEAVLAMVGQPAEDYALRVLSTCGGEKTTAALLPILDGPDLTRAVYAAWVLAQLPDPEVAKKGLRRFALHASFFHQTYQSGSGIDFPIATNLYFHQVTCYLNPHRKPQEGNPGIQIPRELLVVPELSATEQDFLIRDYRQIFADNPNFRQFGGSVFDFEKLMDSSWLPFLRIMAREDAYLEVLNVRGKKIPHFPQRKTASELIAKLTGRPATYLTLSGEELDSSTFPAEPYPEQTRLITRFVRKRMDAATHSPKAPRNQNAVRVEYFNTLIHRLGEEFGEEVKEEILKETSKNKESER